MRAYTTVIVCLLCAAQIGAKTITVGASAGPDNFGRIQTAIDHSRDGDIILVSPGTYREHLNFYGKAITVTSLDPDDPNIVDTTVIRGESQGVPTVNFDSGEQNDTILTGVTVTNWSYQTPDVYEYGTAIRCQYSKPTIKKCRITNCEYGIVGSMVGDGPLLIENHVFSCYGVAVLGCNGEIRSCIMANNKNHGMDGCNGEIRSCIIKNNESDGLSSCNGLLINCLIVGNGRHGVLGGSGSLINCTIVNNEGSGVYGLGWYGEIRNCIIAGNGVYGIEYSGGTLISYNNVWGNSFGSYGPGILPSSKDIHEDPLFVSALSNFRLKSEAGRWDPGLRKWVQDSVTSPCIDAGDPNSPIGTELNPNGGRINMGAYGGTIEASKSPTGIIEKVCRSYPLADLNKDCRVDFMDFAIFASTWLQCNYDPPSMCE